VKDILRPGLLGTEKFPSTGSINEGPHVMLLFVDQVPTSSDGILDEGEDMKTVYLPVRELAVMERRKEE
jgi:hypothetical protein